jgi:hypothetical protein
MRNEPAFKNGNLFDIPAMLCACDIRQWRKWARLGTYPPPQQKAASEARN